MNWIKSTKCTDSGCCVEVSFDGIGAMVDTVAVRSSRVPGEVIWFTPEEWEAFLAGARLGEFNL